MRNMILFAIVVGWASSVFAQYSGQVTDFHTGSPISDVKVQIKGTDKETTTNNQGKFEFPTTTIEKLSEDRIRFGLKSNELVLNGHTQSQVKIFNQSGKKVAQISGTFHNENTRFTLPRLTDGIFLAVVGTETGSFHTNFFYQNGIASSKTNSLSKPLSKNSADFDPGLDNPEIEIPELPPIRVDTLNFTKAGYYAGKSKVTSISSEANVSLKQARFAQMVTIPAGKLGENNVKSFLMDSMEVSRFNYNSVMNPIVALKQTSVEAEALPIGEIVNPVPVLFDFRAKSEVSYYQAILYCNKRSNTYGMDTCYSYSSITESGVLKDLDYDSTKFGFRLPTSSEWKYAAKADHTGEYPWNGATSEASKYAWYSNNATEVKQVAQKRKNSWGLYDMAGNVSEWVFGLNTGFALKASANQLEISPNPIPLPNPNPIPVIIRGFAYGGSFQSDLDDIKTTSLVSRSPTTKSENIGFRAVINYPGGGLIFDLPIREIPDWHFPQL